MAGVLEESFGLLASDGETIPVHSWMPHKSAKAVLVISHGMGEYALRYRPIGTCLAKKRFAVYSNDHRGHGYAIKTSELCGDFGRNGFQNLVDDLRQVIELAARENPNTPIFLLGHSMGSYAAQLYILDHGDTLSGVALCGASALDQRPKYYSDTQMFAVENNAAFETVRTSFDWLSRDLAIVDRYVDDPLCGFVATPHSLRSLYSIAPRLQNSFELQKIDNDLPILMFTGELDPVNGFLSHFNVLIDRYRAAGIHDITTRIYLGARHEILNEINRLEVLDDIANWMSKVMENSSREVTNTHSVLDSYRNAKPYLASVPLN